MAEKIHVEDPFVLDASEYKRDIDVLSHYVKAQVTHLKLISGKDEKTCKDFVLKNLRKGGQFEFKDTPMTYALREENGDRHEQQTTLLSYLREVVKNDEILSGSFTSYLNEEQKVSLIASDVIEKKRLRGVAKKAMFAAEAKKDKATYNIKKTEQTNRKLSNNAVSGAALSPSNPLFNPTAHTTLTSGCRTSASYGNANNEKLLSGSRHYFSHHVVLDNIISIITHVDYEQIEKVLTKYNLVIPSVAQTLDVIWYSTKPYWDYQDGKRRIIQLVSKLEPLQRAAFVYTGDLFQVKQFNEEFFRTFVDKLSTKVYGEIEDPVSVIKQLPESYINHAHQVCGQETEGIGKDYSSILDTPKIHTVALTAKNTALVINEYTDFLKMIVLTTNLPSEVAHMPKALRRCALVSDTDSTIFTVQDWVMWYMGGLDFSDKAYAVCSAIVLLTSNAIRNILAVMAANMRVPKKYLFEIEMKNEFRFDVLVPTQLGKHYYASIGCQEGNVFQKPKMEIKGVHLKSSNLPPKVTKIASDMMKSITDDIKKDLKISIRKYLDIVASVERSIINSILKGEHYFLRASSIKDAQSYSKDEDESPYQKHVFWNTVFGPSFGETPPPPYDTVKVNLLTTKKASFNAWVESFQDTALKQRLKDWMTNKQKSHFPTIYIPSAILQNKGLPDIFVSQVDYRKIVMDLCGIFYLILETLGVYLSESKLSRMVIDYHPELGKQLIDVN